MDWAEELLATPVMPMRQFADTLAQHMAGNRLMLRDLILGTLSAAVRQPWQGGDDELVPRAAAQWLQANVPGLLPPELVALPPTVHQASALFGGEGGVKGARGKKIAVVASPEIMLAFLDAQELERKRDGKKPATRKEQQKALREHFGGRWRQDNQEIAFEMQARRAPRRRS